MAEQPIPRFFLALMIAATLLVALVILPVVSELFLAAILAGVLWPLQKWLTARLWGRRGIAAGVLTVGVVLLLVGPLATMGAFIIADGADGVRFVSDALHSKDVARLIDLLPTGTGDFLRDAIDRLPRDPGELAGQVGAQEGATGVAVAALRATGSFAFHATMMLIALFFLLVRGDEAVAWLDGISPLRPGQTRELLDTFKKVSYAVIVSTGVTSAVQAAAALVGFLIARVPNPVFFALVTFFVAFIPAIGAALVVLLAALLLLVTGHPYMAIFLAAWGLVVVGLVDNLVKPLLIRRGLEVHGAVVFFALIGGIAAFGAIGLLVGPLVVSLFLALLRMYHRDYTPGDPRVPGMPGLPPGGESDASTALNTSAAK